MAFGKTASRVAVLALLAASVAAVEKIEISNDPLDLSNEFPHDYRNWASLLSNVLLKKEGSDDAAAKALERVMLATHGHLSKVANGEEIFPRFHLQDPVLMGGDGGKAAGLPPLQATKFSSSATFFNYAPCVLSESYTGAAASLTGLNIAPTLFQLAPAGVGVFAQGVNIAPQIIYVNPTGANIQPQGLNVQPALIYIGPIGANVQPQGANIQPTLNVAPVGVNVQPQGTVIGPARKSVGPVHVLYNPQKGPVYAPVAHDLAAPAAGDAGAVAGTTV